MHTCFMREVNAPWTWEESREPRPAPGQVVLRVLASGICGTDVFLRRGQLPVVSLPIVPGHEYVGEVAELGVGVTHLKVGDRVGVGWWQRGCGRCRYCQVGDIFCCSNPQDWVTVGGGNAEYTVAWADGCMLLPKRCSPIEAAPLFCAGHTIASGLRGARPKPGERVGILGLGGLGHIAVQYAHAIGLETVVITTSEEKEQDAKKLGADIVLLLSAEDPSVTLDRIGGVDILLSTIPSAEIASAAIAGMRPYGRFVNAGRLDGPLVPESVRMMNLQYQILGALATGRHELFELVELLARGKIKPLVETYPFHQVNQALDRLDQGKVRYRAVLTPEG